MPYLTIDEFKILLRSSSLEEITQRHIFDGEAFCFRANPKDYQLMRNLLAKSIRLSAEACTIVGSGKTGFSLDPKNPFIPFSTARDIDVVVVDSGLFDAFWSYLISWSYPLGRYVPPNDYRWLSTHKDDVFWGYVYPGLRIPRSPALPQLMAPIRAFYSLWQSAFQGLGRYQAFSGLRIEGRLYRTWDHARAYHVEGLRLILSGLESTKER